MPLLLIKSGDGIFADILIGFLWVFCLILISLPSLLTTTDPLINNSLLLLPLIDKYQTHMYISIRHKN